MRLEEASAICRILSDPHRLAILEKLMEREQYGSELLRDLTISQPTLSHHLKAMVEGDLLTERREGKRTYYGVDRRTWDEFMLMLDSLSGDTYWSSGKEEAHAGGGV